MKNNYIDRAKQIEEELKEMYQHFHQNPELSGEEWETQKWILECLTSWGVECRPCADTGVYAVIKSGKPGHTIAFRADIDALPIKEQTGFSFQSKNDGKMHACGHDAHTTILLGSIKLLQEMKEQLVGNVVFLFQPAEEKDGGAKRMLAEHVLDNPPVELIVAFHMWPQPAHTITCLAGPVMAQSDSFKIMVTGKGGHGGLPHKAKNPITALATMVPMLEKIPAMMVAAHETAVVNICQIHGGDRYNVVSDQGFLEGTIRTFDSEIREDIIRQIKKIAETVPEIYGMQGELSLDSGYEPTINDQAAAIWAVDILAEKLSEVEIIGDDTPSMLGEDFSYFGQQVAALFMWLGYWKADEAEQFPLHHKKFQIDETVLSEGVAAFCVLAEEFTKEGLKQ